MILVIADNKLFLYLDREQMEYNQMISTNSDALQKAEFEENLIFMEIRDLELIDMRYK